MDLTPFLVDEYVPEEEEVAWEVRHLDRNRAGKLPGMRAEHLRSWLWAAMKEDLPNPSHWEKGVSLIQAALLKGHLADECTC